MSQYFVMIVLLLCFLVSGYNNNVNRIISYNSNNAQSIMKSRTALSSSSSSSTPPTLSSATNKLQKMIAILSLSLSLSNGISIENSIAASGAGTVSALEDSISRLETSETRSDVLQSMAGNYDMNHQH